jgi:hypothetical protein
MKPLLVLSLLIVPLLVASGVGDPDGFNLSYPAKKHWSARQLYQADGSSGAKQKIIGQFVLLDVVVVIERDVPLVEIVVPKELAEGSARPSRVIQAHLISATTVASSLKKGERHRIEGILVDEGFGAYTIYLHRAQPIR